MYVCMYVCVCMYVSVCVCVCGADNPDTTLVSLLEYKSQDMHDLTDVIDIPWPLLHQLRNCWNEKDGRKCFI